MAKVKAPPADTAEHVTSGTPTGQDEYGNPAEPGEDHL
jgi:hypothetical protein